jgi:hypothetical protein
LVGKNKKKRQQGSILLTTQESGKMSKQSSNYAHKNADEVWGLLQILEKYKSTLDNTVELNQKLMKKMQQNNKYKIMFLI